MWCVISGAPGTGKHEIATHLMKQGYTYDVTMPTYFSESLNTKEAFDLQLDMMISRYAMQRGVQVRALEEDIVTVGSFWDIHEVYSQVLVQRGMLDAGDYANLARVYRALGMTLESPQKVIFTTATKLDSEAKRSLRGQRELNEEFFDLVVGQYRTYIDTRVRCPHQEVDISLKAFDQTLFDVVASLSYGDKVKAQSLWTKAYLK